MDSTFQTDRLLVYKVNVKRDPHGGFDLYLAYERAENDHPYCQVVECSTAHGENCVLWVETHGRLREGFAIELLNGIATHNRFKEPLYPNNTIKDLANALFARHETWFATKR